MPVKAGRKVVRCAAPEGGRWRIPSRKEVIGVVRNVPGSATSFLTPEALEEARDLTEARRRVADAGPDAWLPWEELDAGR